MVSCRVVPEVTLLVREARLVYRLAIMLVFNTKPCARLFGSAGNEVRAVSAQHESRRISLLTQVDSLLECAHRPMIDEVAAGTFLAPLGIEISPPPLSPSGTLSPAIGDPAVIVKILTHSGLPARRVDLFQAA